MTKHTGKLRSKKWQAALLATVLGASLGAVPTAQAAILALTVPSDYTTSQLGAVTGSRVTTHVDAAPTAGLMKDLNRDPALYPGVTINGQSLMLLRQYNYSTTDLKPLMILNPDSNPPEIVAQGIVKAAANPHGAASNGTHVFMADYDNGVVAGATVNGNQIEENENLTLTTERVFQDLQTAQRDNRVPFAYDPENVTLHAEGLYMEGNQLLVAYNVNDSKLGWAKYYDGFMLQYEVMPNNTLKFRGAAPIGRNVDSLRINKYNDSYITNAIGGMQHYGGERNPESGMFIVKGNLEAGLGHPNAYETFHHQAVIPDNVTEQLDTHYSDFYHSKITPDGQAYVLTYGLEAGKVNRYQVWKTTVSNLAAEDPEDWEKIVDTSPNAGWFGRIDYDYYTKRLWAEIGSYLFVYTDGDTKPTRGWEAKSFSTQENHTMFNSVGIIGGDKITGTLATLAQTAPQGINVYQNAKAQPPAGAVRYKDTLTATDEDTSYDGVTDDYQLYRFTKDIQIARKTKNDLGDLNTNVFAGIFLRDGEDADIEADGHVLGIDSRSHFGSPVGIYVTNGKNATIKADRVNIKTVVNATNGNAITRGIWNDAMTDKSSSIEITGDVDLSMVGGYGGYGVAVQKLDRWGEKSNAATVSSQINIHGDLSIRKSDGSDWGIGANLDNVYSRFNSAGLLTTVDQSEITVDGNVDLAVYGNGITTRGQDSKVSIGGGRIVVPSGTGYGYYSVGSYLGTVNVNTGTDGKTPGNHRVQLEGDVFTLSTGTVNLALTDAQSYLNGIVDNGGKASLTLQNGATWFNNQRNTRYAEDNEDVGAGEKSRVTTLTGGSDAAQAGVIFQKDSKDLTIDNYSGHTTVLYENDGLSIKGGNLIIGSAAPSSAVTLRTNGDGLNTSADASEVDKELLNHTLNKLANKAFYTAYATGEKNLTGKVEVAEGLTAQSASKLLKDITWKDADGQGQYIPKEKEEPSEQTKTVFNKPITGDTDQEYADAHVKHELNYDFTKDSTIAIDISPYGGNIAGVYISRNKDVNINHADHKLAIHTDGEQSMLVGIDTTGDNGKVHINGKELEVVVNNHKSGSTTKAYGIFNFAKGNVIDINADTKVSTKNDNISYGIHVTNDGQISLNGGNTEITVNKDAKNSASIAVKAGGMYSPNGPAVVNVNYADGAIKDAGKTVKLHGDVWATSFATGGEYNKKLNQEAQVNLGLSGTDSEWEGLVGYTVANTAADDYDEYDSEHYTAGAVTLALQNGAQWKNTAYNAANLMTTDWAGWKGSRLTNLYGGSDADHAGVIFQKDKNDITIDNYSGHTLVIYDHNPTAARDAVPGLEMIGGNIVIGKAAENSEITLRTDAKGLNTAEDAAAADKNMVSATLNNLANKAFYTAYKDGERHLKGHVEIAEGLTAQSASKRLEDITWKDADGQGQYLFTPAKEIPAEQTDTTFGVAILGSKERDTHYVETGVLKDGLYNFTKETTFEIDGIADPESHKRELVYGDTWVIKDLHAAISGSLPQTDAKGNPVKENEGQFNGVHMDMNNQALHMDVRYKGHGAAIAAVGGKGTKTKVEIDNAGPIDIATKADRYSIGVFANRGGEVVIHNGGADAENKILKIRSLTNGGDDNTGNGLKAMDTGKITIDGLVDIEADGKRNEDGYVSNTAIGSVASTINIGGGSIKTVNNAWMAVQAYGQFVSNDYGMVNINTKDAVFGAIPAAKPGDKSPGNNMRSFNAGTNRVQIEGDFITKGGMGYRGQINVGLRGTDSYWEGNYTDENPEVITGAQEAGAVNLKIHDGAHWKGVSNGSVNAYIEGADSYWRGYHFGGDMSLTLKDRAVWHNALIKGNTVSQNNVLKYFTSNDGVIDMTGAQAFSTEVSDARYGQKFYRHTDESNSDTGDIVIKNYSGNATVLYAHDAAKPADIKDGLAIKGGTITIGTATEGSVLTLRTDGAGLNTAADASMADKNLVSYTLNNLANKAFYTAYKDGERHLKGKVEIAEGLTAQSASKRLEDITWKDADGQGQYLFTPEALPAEQTETTFGQAILGSADRDTAYVSTGVLKDGVYRFTKPETTIEIDGIADKAEGKRDLVGFGPWFNGLSAAVSGSTPIYDAEGNEIKYDKNTITSNNVTMDMGGNKLNIRAKYNQGAGQTGIAAIAPMNRVDGAGIVDIKNAGAMNINVKGSGMTAALFVDGGGKIFIRNGGENAKDKVLVLRGNAKNKNSGVGIKSMNGNIAANSGDKKHSEITIDGLVDVVADGTQTEDGYASNEAVSAVASDINIGGGSIKAVNGAWAAIRAYGEFTTPNYGIVNVNAANRQYTLEDGQAMGGKVKVHKVSDFTIGEYDTVIEGDIVTNGGMGTKGQVNIGLKDKNSHWIGNYADTQGYGVTQGMFGAVNIKMKDGAYWKGFGNGSMNIVAEGKDTYWHGFSMQDKMQLTLKDGATWYNAITAEQKDQKGKAASAQIGYLTTVDGVIDMTGANVFTASSESLSGRTTADNPSGIVESTDGITGDVFIKNYSGNATVIYAHDAAKPADIKDGLAIKGGTITIGTATEGSVLTLRTDGAGLNTAADASAADKNLVSYTLNNLANKAFYTAYKDGERHLKGKVEIAEGLTAQSASKRLEDMTWKEETGQGQYLFTEAVPDTQVVNPMKQSIDGTEESEKTYTDAGIYKAADDTYHFTPEEDPAQVIADNAVVADKKDIHLESKGNLRLDSKNTGIQADGHSVKADVKGLEVNSDAQGITAKNGNVTVNGNTVVNAADGIRANEQGRVELNGTAVVNTKGGTAISADKGVVKLGGKTTVEAKTAITAANQGTVTADEAVDLTATDAIVANAGGKVSLDKGGRAKGNITADGEGSIIVTKDLGVSGDITARAKGGITLQEGSVKAGTVTADGADSRVLLTDGAYDIEKVVSAGGGDVHIDSAKGETTLIKGIETKENSTAKVALNGAKAMLKGNVRGNGDTQLAVNDAAVWEGVSETDNLAVDLNDGGIWKNMGPSRMKRLGGNGIVDMTQSGEGTTTVQNYAGKLTFIYAHDQNHPTSIYGNDLKIGHAAEGSSIKLRTDAGGLRVGSNKAADWNLVSKTLNALAGKVYYEAYKDGETRLNGTVEIAEGLTAQSASKRLESIVWNKTSGQGQYIFTEKEDKVEHDPDIIYGPKETAMMRGAKSAMTGAMLSWRAENDDLSKRLGELRLGGDTDGAWGRIYGGKQSYHAQNADVETDVKAVQIGYDKALSSGWHAGVALSYLEGDNRYPAAGTGTTKLVNVTGYATKADTDGSYLDLTLKGSRVKNNYTVYNDMKHSLVGEYDTNGVMAGVEYGKRIERANGVYVTPQAALTYGHLMKEDYDAVSSFAGGKKLHVEQDGFDSLIGRIGVEVGQQTDRTNVFAKLSVLHEFMGKTGATYSAVNEPTSRTEIDFGDTWLLVGVGGTHRLSDSTYIYGNLERSFGGDFKEDWRADLGLRWMF